MDRQLCHRENSPGKSKDPQDTAFVGGISPGKTPQKL